MGVIVPSVSANERSQRRKRMAKFIRLDTKFEGPVYLDPEHIQVVCTPESDSPSPGVKVVLSSGIWFVVQGRVADVAQQIEDALTSKGPT